MRNYPYVITVSSEKGGVGKTTLATNLAIYLKALNEELPVTIFSFDNHFTVDKMFEIKGQQITGTVADLLMETPATKLLHTGQYGVNYIPSSTSLADLKGSVKGPMVLARLLAQSDVSGIIIVDTRPDLDILTQNALYAADRVIIPVKDMPSLENCRNIFDLFDKKGLNRKSLSLIPCLIDSRIKYDGPFRDQKELLKGYAVNRGFRCVDVFISKSPKVDSLNTNPDGRVYPILTHARWTEVHGQFARLARLLMDEFDEVKDPRALLFHQWMNEEEGRKKESFEARLSGLKTNCILCGNQLDAEKGNVSYYFETEDGGACGHIEEECFLRFLMSAIYNLDGNFAADDPTWVMFRQSALESAFVFRPLPVETGTALVDFQRIDHQGNLLASKKYPLRERQGFFSREADPLHRLMTETLTETEGKLRDSFVMVYPVNPKDPHSILFEERYRTFRRTLGKVAARIAAA